MNNNITIEERQKHDSKQQQDNRKITDNSNKSQRNDRRTTNGNEYQRNDRRTGNTTMNNSTTTEERQWMIKERKTKERLK